MFNCDLNNMLLLFVIACVLVECTAHRGSHNKEMLIKELDRLGVNYDVRRLQVGDFLWIAQNISGADDLTLFEFNLLRFSFSVVI